VESGIRDKSEAETNPKLILFFSFNRETNPKQAREQSQAKRSDDLERMPTLVTPELTVQRLSSKVELEAWVGQCSLSPWEVAG
jgi:hypothetical protein